MSGAGLGKTSRDLREYPGEECFRDIRSLFPEGICLPRAERETRPATVLWANTAKADGRCARGGYLLFSTIHLRQWQHRFHRTDRAPLETLTVAALSQFPRVSPRRQSPLEDVASYPQHKFVKVPARS